MEPIGILHGFLRLQPLKEMKKSQANQKEITRKSWPKNMEEKGHQNIMSANHNEIIWKSSASIIILETSPKILQRTLYPKWSQLSVCQIGPRQNQMQQTNVSIFKSNVDCMFLQDHEPPTLVVDANRTAAATTTATTPEPPPQQQ